MSTHDAETTIAFLNFASKPLALGFMAVRPNFAGEARVAVISK
jgi:hypothetical protein